MPTTSYNKLLKDLRQAYLKYKTYVYYDGNELFQREKLARYEMYDDVLEMDIPSNEALEDKLSALAREIEDYSDNEKAGDIFGEMGIHYLPKNFKNSEKGNSKNSNFITNRRVNDKYELEEVIVMANLPVEWQLISVLWIMKYGYLLDGMLDDACKGNRLELDKGSGKLKSGGFLYKPYFVQYQKWRDDAVDTAQHSLAKGNDVAFVELDVKDYFYSVAIDFVDVEDVINKNGDRGIKNCNVHKLFKKLHIAYTKKLEEDKYPHSFPDDYSPSKRDKCLLPIGLTSSYVLANYYLHKFDKRVKNLVPNAYYGRYVDDILLVIENPDIKFHDEEKCKEIKFDLQEYIKKSSLNDIKGIKTSCLSKSEKFILERFHPIIQLTKTPKHIKGADSERIFELTCFKGAFVQPSKTRIQFFDKDESTAVIDKLKHDLNVRASEFRDFPEDMEDMTSFDDSAYHLVFDDSEGKIGTLKDYKENRLGLSIFLANRIFAALRRVKKTDDEECERVLVLFRGLNNLKNFRLWEKIFTFFMVNKDKERFVRFYEHTKEQIKKLKSEDKIADSEITGLDVAESLKKYLNIAIEMTLALNPYFIVESDEGYNHLEEICNRCKGQNSLFKITFLIRHHYEVHPLVVFAEKPPKDLTNNDISILSNEGATKFSNIKGSSIRIPRKVKFWECCIAKVNEWITQEDDSKDSSFNGTYLNCNFSKVDMLDCAYGLYKKINGFYIGEEEVEAESKDTYKDKFYKVSTENGKTKIDGSAIHIKEIRIGDTREKDGDNDYSPMLAIANTRVQEKNVEQSIIGKPNLNSSRYNRLGKILKEARLSGSKMLILPECSVPVALLPSLARYSAKNEMAIITGVEHWNVNGVVYNFIVTIAPVTVNHNKDAVVLYRLKNHYSPAEEVIIREYDLKVPKPNPYRYDLMNWEGIYFTTFYCYEMANSLHRSLFRSKVDLMIISEWNSDTAYFSDMVGATTRDLHCYIAQVNTSQYGDSRITQPTMSATKDMLKLKGGTNDTILSESINITKLRNFQLKSYSRTKHDGDKSFKPLPPDWDRETVKKRNKGDFVMNFEVCISKKSSLVDKNEITNRIIISDDLL